MVTALAIGLGSTYNVATCFKPKHVTVSKSFTSTEAQISWTSGLRFEYEKLDNSKSIGFFFVKASFSEE